MQSKNSDSYYIQGKRANKFDQLGFSIPPVSNHALVPPNLYDFPHYHAKNEFKVESSIRASPELLSAWTELKLAKSKLQTSAKISSLMAGFAIVAMIEIQFERNETPIPLLVTFCIVTTILIFSHLTSLVISSSILPTLDTISETYIPEIIYQSPHRRLNFFIQLSWFISNMWGNFLMVILVTLVLWIKFARYDIIGNVNVTVTNQIASILAPIVATSLVVPILFVLIMVSFYIYATMNKHKLKIQGNNLKELEEKVESLKLTAHHLKPV